MGRIFKIFISVFMFLYGIYYFGIPKIINLPDKRELIEQTVLKETDYRLSLKKPNIKMGILPSVIFYADEIAILNDDNTTAFGAKDVKFNVKLFPLIFKRIEIKDCYAKSVDLNLVFDKDFNLKLGQYNINTIHKSDFKLNKINFKTDDYNIYLNDEYQNKKVLFDGKSLIIKFNNEKNIAVETFANILAGEKASDIELKFETALNKISNKKTYMFGKIANLDLSEFSSYVKSLSQDRIKSLSGLINIDADTDIKQNKIKLSADIKNLGIYKEQSEESVYYDGLLSINSELSLLNNGFEITQSRIEGDGISAFATGKILNINSKLPNLDLKIGINNSKAEKFVHLLPPVHDLSPDMDFLLIKKAGFWGDVWGNLEVKGKADFPNVNGKILIKNAYMVREIPNAKKAVILLDFTGDKMNLDVTVPTSPSQTVWVKGPIDITRKEHPADLYITSTDDVDLKTAQIVLNPLHEILHFELGPVPIMDIKGKGGINLRVKGTRQRPYAWGEFYFKDAVVSFLDIHNMEILNGSGSLKFNSQNTWFESNTANLNGKPVSIKGSCTLLGVFNFDVVSDAQDLGKLLNTVKTSPMLEDIQELVKSIEAVSGLTNVKINLTGQVIDPKDIVFNKNMFAKGSLELLSNALKFNGIQISNVKGLINFNNTDADFSLKSSLDNSIINIDGKIKNDTGNLKVVSDRFNLTANASKISSQNPIINGYGKFNALDLSIINNLDIQKLLPADISKQLKDIEISGETDISLRARNSNFNVYSEFDGINILYKPTNTKIILQSGNVLLQNSTLNLNKITSQVGQMPVFIDGKVYNIYKNPNLNLYANVKLAQDFFDSFYNTKSIYPVKVKGDAILSSKISGVLNNINAKSTLDIKENSSLYYMGATIGDAENSVKITVDETYSKNKIKLNDLKYDKIIMSQNNKPFVNTQLNSSGTLTLLPDGNIGFNNFKIKTKNPTDAKIFNIIFRKPFMKQGVFNSDLVLNGTSLNPKILGKLDITSIDLPFFDSTVRDINLDFKPDKVFVFSKGKVADNDVDFEASLKNKFTPPYIVEDIKLQLADLNINKIDDTIRDIEADSARIPNIKSDRNPFDISQLVIKSAEIQADKIHVRNIDATNFFAKLKLSEKAVLNVAEFKFNIAQGLVHGSLSGDINKGDLRLTIHLNDANAAIMSEALFDLKGQVFGSVNGDFNLSCSGMLEDNCFNTLSGEGTFKISEGRMPKLGSLEYLLKAGNLLKSGLTGLSINSLVDLVTPLKTGDFESISGDIHISDGIADKINVYSKGNDLNMYMNGSYNIVSSVADMKIYGSLSKNITTVFGKIKNVSLNTLFNTIPGVNDSTESLKMQENIGKIPNINDVTDVYRIFTADINGDINGTNYVKSFKWVK